MSRDLREPFAFIADELARTMEGELRDDAKKYPTTHHEMRACIESVLRKFDVRLRPVPLDRSEIEEPPDACPVCCKSLEDAPSVVTLRRPDGSSGPRRLLAHAECVSFRKDGS